MSRARRNPAPGFTAPVALAAIMGDKTLAELAEEGDGHPNQISAGKPQVQESAVVVFGGPTHVKKTVERTGDSITIVGGTDVEPFEYEESLDDDLYDLCPVVDRLRRATIRS